MIRLSLTQPDDFHLHLRDGDALALTVKHAAAQFNRVTVMPNLQPAVDDTASALAYLARIQAHIPQQADFTPIMTIYLTEMPVSQRLSFIHKGQLQTRLRGLPISRHSRILLPIWQNWVSNC